MTFPISEFRYGGLANIKNNVLITEQIAQPPILISCPLAQPPICPLGLRPSLDVGTWNRTDSEQAAIPLPRKVR